MRVTEGVNDFFISHVAREDGSADLFVAAFHAEFDHFAACLFERVRDFSVEIINVGVDDKRDCC